MKRNCLLVFLSVVLAATGLMTSSAAAADPALVVKAFLTAVPATYEGYCPTKIKFNGVLEVNEPCTLKYKFARSDGAIPPIFTIVCPKPGKYAVTTTWSLGKSYTGWVMLEVVSPVSVTSAKANFTIKCWPKPNIANALLKYMGDPEPEMDISGTNFGAVQGTKNVKIDGTVITAMPGWSVLAWSDTAISLQTEDIIPWEHVYQIEIVDGATVISNTFSKRFLYTVESITPENGLANSNVQVFVWDLPPVPGGLVLKLGSYNFSILTWGTPIMAKVPAAPLGSYKVYLMKGTDTVSSSVNFQVGLKPIPVKKED